MWAIFKLPQLLFQTEDKWKAIVMKMSFYSHEKKIYFHKSERFWKWEFFKVAMVCCLLLLLSEIRRFLTAFCYNVIILRGWLCEGKVKWILSSDELLVWARWPILPIWGHLLYPARKDYDLAKLILNSLLFGQDGWKSCGSRTVFWLLFEWVSCRKIRLAFVFDAT